MTSSTRQVCTFMLDDLLFGVDVTSVREVIRAQPMTRVPLAPPAVRGLINLRGQIVTAVDMRERLGLPARGAEFDAMNVVVNGGDGAISLLVDEIGDVLELNEGDAEPTPENLSSTIRELVEGVYKLDAGLLLLFDANRLSEIVSPEPGQLSYA
jgi:purine-binding chemotaxis protein CheW